MNTLQILQRCRTAPESEDDRIQYAMLTLHELARRIATWGDAEALAEWHNRTPFYLEGEGPVCFVTFVDKLRRRALDRANEHADKAYDLTLDKFSRLDRLPHNHCAPAVRSPSQGGPDCRCYFGAFARSLDKQQPLLEGMMGLERERHEAKILQGLVQRHFLLSLRDCQRNSFMTRYVWRLAGGDLTVLMPRSISGRARQKWLQANIGEVDLNRPNEQARIQAIIDHHVGQPRLLSLSEDRETAYDDELPLAQMPGEDRLAVSVEGLADTVAKEKAANILKLRPAIQALGPAQLQEMILQIFDALADEQYCLVQTAQRFGLSKATLSRFAGIRWNADEATLGSGVPDLWRNTAQVIGNDPHFVEAANRAGVWQLVKQLAYGGHCVLAKGKAIQ